MDRIGRPPKRVETLYKVKKNIRLALGMDKMLREISDHTGIPCETLLRSYANEGIRRDYEKIHGSLIA